MSKVWLVAAVLAALIVGVVGLQAGRAWRSALTEYEPVPARFVLPEPLEGLSTPALKTRSGLKIGASYVPPKNGVAVLLAHGTGANREQLWPEARMLVAEGFGVLAFDWPGYGESEGEIHLGTNERAAFTACVDFLAGQPGVQRIGALGYSQGAGLLTAFVADEPRVTSLIALNGWTSSLDQLRYEYRRWGPIRQLPVIAVARSHIEGGDLRPIDVAPKLKGRKTLFIASLVDEVVPPAMSADLAAAAGGEVRFVEAARHTTVREAMRDWPRTLIEFFSK